MTSDSVKGLRGVGEYKITRRTSFEEATHVSRRGEDPVYNAEVPQDWCFGPVANGGYICSLLSRVVTQHIQSLFSSSASQLPDIPISNNLNYFAPVLPGPAEIKVESRWSSRNSACLVASLYQNGTTNSETEQSTKQSLSLRTEATVFMVTAKSMSRRTLSKAMSSRRRIPLSEMYTRNVKGHHVPQHDSGMSFYQYKPGWECYFRPESANKIKMLNQHPQHGPAVFDVWWKFDHNITVHELGLLADLIGPVIFNYEDVRKTYWLSTRSMSTEIVRLPPESNDNWTWLFCRMELIENVDDRVYCDVTIADEDGNVVGVARQSCVLRPFEFIGKRRTENQGSQKAKI